MTIHRALLALLFIVGSREAAAQGTLSTQGLGFPPGQLSTHAKTMGGATGETDPVSPLNPAAIGLLNAAILAFHVEPEYRDIRVGDRSLSTTVSRFPLFMGAMTLGGKWVVSLSSSTLLDRTYQTTTRDSQVVGGDSVKSTLTERSEGALNDIRLALSYSPSPWLKIGLGGHALSGSDVVQTVRAFDDTLRFATDAQRAVVGFGGNALSVGAVTMFPRVGAIGVSYRRGGTVRSYDDDVVVGSGRAPDHFGISAVYLGIRGTALAVRAAKDNWSQLEGMARTLDIHEGWDFGVGADVTGPRFGASAIGLRAGGRWRTLPFSPGSSPVKEKTWSGGFVIPFARRTVELHFGALRSSREYDLIATEGGPASEKSWTLSTGFSVRP
jgi:hypothetical protein